MDLFIIDNVGEQSLLDKDQYSNVNEGRILKENDKKQIEIVNRTENDDDDEDDSVSDYGGKLNKHITNFSICLNSKIVYRFRTCRS